MENSSLNETLEEWKEFYARLKLHCVQLEGDLRKTEILIQNLTNENAKLLSQIKALNEIQCRLCCKLKSFTEFNTQNILNAFSAVDDHDQCKFCTKLKNYAELNLQNFKETNVVDYDDEYLGDEVGSDIDKGDATGAKIETDDLDEVDLKVEGDINLDPNDKENATSFIKTSKLKRITHFLENEENQELKSANNLETRGVKASSMNNSGMHQAAESDLKCTFCGKCSASKSALRKHIRFIHTEREKSYSCELCDNSFTRRDNLTKHLNTIHQKNKVEHESIIKCKRCQEQFSCKEDLLKHKSSHKPLWKCKKCSKVYKSHFSLQTHDSMAHSGIIYKCPKCDYTTNHKFNLARHIELHDNTKCVLCNEDFRSQKHLKIHKATKHKKPKCYLCKEEFPSLEDLKIHKTLKHRKSYNCKECPKVFKTLDGIKAHEMSYHNENGDELICPECIYTTKNKIFMDAHIRRHKIKENGKVLENINPELLTK